MSFLFWVMPYKFVGYTPKKGRTSRVQVGLRVERASGLELRAWGVWGWSVRMPELRERAGLIWFDLLSSYT